MCWGSPARMASGRTMWASRSSHLEPWRTAAQAILLVSRQRQRRQSVPVPRQPVYRRREPELDQGHTCDQVRLHLLSLRPEPLPAHQRRRRQQSARRLSVPGRHDLQLGQLRNYRSTTLWPTSCWACPTMGTGMAVAKDDAVVQPQRPALDRMPVMRRISGRLPRS